MIFAHEEDIGNNGGKARVLIKHRFLVDAHEPVAEVAYHPDPAVGEGLEGNEVLKEHIEEPAHVARVVPGKAAEVVGSVSPLAFPDHLRQVLHVEDHIRLLSRTAMLVNRSVV